MLLFRFADLPRRVRRLRPALPLDPTATALEDHAGAAVVTWTLAPTLLDPGERRQQARIKRVLALYAAAEGQPRSMLDALAVRIEEIMGNYRLARCLAQTIEQGGYHFVPPPLTLPYEPVALRALCYRRAQERNSGYVPRAERAAFLAAIAAGLDTTPAQLEAALWADRPDVALLQRRANTASDAAEALHPASVTARYNAAAVATVVAASSWVTLHLDASATTALKDLYRHARALHVGTEITRGATDDLLDLTLYGPGSRALVRSRAALATGAGTAETDERTDAGVLTDESPEDDTSSPEDDAPDVPGAGDEWNDGAARGAADIRIPAAGGSAVAAVVARLVRRHPAAVRSGWTRLLGPDRRLYHVPLEAELLTALRGGLTEDADTTVGDVAYDSAVEEHFARAFHAHESGGRGGLVRGWTLRREPRTVLVGTTVFLPDFSFRRGEAEVYGEVIGYYTEDYLARKRRKLAALRGQLPLLLMIDRELAPVFAGTGFPVVTYKAGRQISVTDVVSTLEQVFDPFARRRERARAVLSRLCATAGPDVPEEELSIAVGCAGRSELLALWNDLLAADEEEGDTATMGPLRRAPADQSDAAMAEPLRRVAEALAPYNVDGADRFPRRYLPGYGLVRTQVLAAARSALIQLLSEAGGPVPLGDALARVMSAGVADPDEALLERLGAVVTRAGLFGESHVSLSATSIE